MADEPLPTWPLATLDDFKRACAALRIDPDWDTGRMGTFAALARLQERILSLEARLASYEAAYGPRLDRLEGTDSAAAATRALEGRSKV